MFSTIDTHHIDCFELFRSEKIEGGWVLVEEKGRYPGFEETICLAPPLSIQEGI